MTTRSTDRNARSVWEARSFVAALAVTLLGACGPQLRDVPDGTARSQSRLSWETWPELPDAFGLGGPFVGVLADGLVVGGGANFPEGPPWAAGPKVWHDGLWRLDAPDGHWVSWGALPRPAAYGLVVPDGDGLLLVGGGDGEGAHADVTRLSVAADGAPRWEAWPALPEPSAFHAGARVGDTLWVLAGQADAAGRRLHDALWSLDLSASADAPATWQRHPGCPGGARIKAAAAAQTLGDGTPVLLVAGGEHPDAGILDDVWTWHPGAERWTARASLPEPRAAAAAVAVGQSHVLVFTGDTGRARALPLAERPPFDGDTLAYHTITDTWVALDAPPEGVVTTSAVSWRGRLVLASGEVRPGVRTRAVQAATVERAESRFGTLDLVVLVAYLLGLVAIGARFARRNTGTADYFVAGRRIPWWAAGLSIYGTQLSAITFLATPALAYSTDLRYAPTWLAILIMAPLVNRVHLPFFRRLAVTTAYEYLERRFSYGVRLFGSLAFMIYQLARMAIVVYLPALALAAVTGLDVSGCILVMGVLATAYTVLGGMEAVIWTDVLQVFVLLGGVGLALSLALSDVGGVAGVRALAEGYAVLDLWDGGFAFTESASWSLMLGAVFLQFGPYTTDQAVIQRYLTTRDERGAARGLLLNGWMSVPAALLFPTLGACLWAWYRSRPEALAVGMANDEIVPLFVGQRLPAGAAGLVIAGLFAATMSSLDSSMHSVATAASVDLHGRLRPGLDDRARLRVARRLTVLVGVLGTLGALALARTDERSLFLLFQKAVGLLSSGVAGIFLLGLFTRRVGSGAALLGAAAGTGVLVWVTWFSPLHPFWSAAVGIGSCVVAGLLAALVWRGEPPPPGLVHADLRAGLMPEEEAP